MKSEIEDLVKFKQLKRNLESFIVSIESEELPFLPDDSCLRKAKETLSLVISTIECIESLEGDS